MLTEWTECQSVGSGLREILRDTTCLCPTPCNAVTMASYVVTDKSKKSISK